MPHLINHNLWIGVRRDKREVIRTASRWDSNHLRAPGGQKECQPCVRDHHVSPSMTRAPTLPSLSQPAWTSYQGGAPSLPCLSWGCGEGPKARIQGLQQLSLLKPTEGQAGSSPSPEGAQHGRPCSSGPTLPTCHLPRRHLLQLRPARHHRLAPVGKGALTPG